MTQDRVDRILEYIGRAGPYAFSNRKARLELGKSIAYGLNIPHAHVQGWVDEMEGLNLKDQADKQFLIDMLLNL